MSSFFLLTIEKWSEKSSPEESLNSEYQQTTRLSCRSFETAIDAVLSDLYRLEAEEGKFDYSPDRDEVIAQLVTSWEADCGWSSFYDSNCDFFYGFRTKYSIVRKNR